MVRVFGACQSRFFRGLARRRVLARCSKPRILMVRMNRRSACLLFGVVSFVGCGARTGTLDFGAGVPDDNGGAPNSGAPDVAGGPAFAGSPSFAGAPSFAAGAPSIGGAPTFAAGAPSFFAGAPSFAAGAPSIGGAPSFGGFAGKGGAPSVAGAPSFGGGPSGSGGGEGGLIVDACVAIASNACDKCLCTSCSTQVVSCFSDSQCTSIFSCIVRTGCQGVGCFARNTCRNVIQSNGGLTGPAVSQVLSLATCAAESQTGCACN